MIIKFLRFYKIKLINFLIKKKKNKIFFYILKLKIILL